MSLMNPKTLIVVYKNELFSNQIKKLIETDDDIDDDNIVGVKDGSVKVVSWDEKTWADQKKTGKIASKVLFIGNIKGSGKLLPLVDYKYDQFGVKYGWAGSQAIVMAEAKALSKKEDYEAFLKAFSLLSEKTIGEIKAEENAEDEQPAEDVSDQTNEETAGKNVSYTSQVIERIKKDKAAKAKEEKSPRAAANKEVVNPFLSTLATIIDPVSLAVTSTVNYIGNKVKIEEQQYLYGLQHFYYYGLNEFLGK